MATISPAQMQSQGLPTRLFVLDPVKNIAEYQVARDAAYGLIMGRITGKGGLPGDYDVRPISPGDDLTSANFATSSNYNGDWSIGSASITETTGSFLTGGNTILSGTMPQDRYMVFYGSEIQTPGSPPEIGWVFKSGANVKAWWAFQELLGFDHPRAIARLAPVSGPSEPVAQLCISVAALAVQDAHLTLWAEPIGTSITAANLRA